MIEDNLINNVIWAIIAVSAAVGGVSATSTISLWERLKSSIASLESLNPLEVEVARRDINTIRFIITPHIISIFLLSFNSIFGLLVVTGQLISLYYTALILLLLFCTGLYSFLIPFVIALRDDFHLIKLHEETLVKDQRGKNNEFH